MQLLHIGSNKLIKIVAIFLTIAFLVLGLSACGSGDGGDHVSTSTTIETAQNIQLVDVAGFKQAIVTNEEGIILDVRTSAEYIEGHIEGAVNIDFYQTDFGYNIAALDHSQTYMIYCRTGNRSGSTRQLMQDLNFENVYELDGGTVAWTAAGEDLTR